MRSYLSLVILCLVIGALTWPAFTAIVSEPIAAVLAVLWLGLLATLGNAIIRGRWRPW